LIDTVYLKHSSVLTIAEFSLILVRSLTAQHRDELQHLYHNCRCYLWRTW